MIIINTIKGPEFRVTESEYEDILKSDKEIYIPRTGVYISKSSISTAYPEQLVDEIEERKQQKTGILHDGRRVKRHFGEWVLADGCYADDDNNYHPIKIDPEYYPEVAKDCVMTEKEFEKVKNLSIEERKKLIGGGNKNQNREGSSFAKQLSDKFTM